MRLIKILRSAHVNHQCLACPVTWDRRDQDAPSDPRSAMIDQTWSPRAFQTLNPWVHEDQSILSRLYLHFAIAHCWTRTSTVTLHHRDRVHVAKQDHGSDTRDQEYGTKAVHPWHRCQLRPAGHSLSDKRTAATLAQHRARSRSACRLGICTNGAGGLPLQRHAFNLTRSVRRMFQERQRRDRVSESQGQGGAPKARNHRETASATCASQSSCHRPGHKSRDRQDRRGPECALRGLQTRSRTRPPT